MDPYVLALQLYLFNKACGGLPLRIAEQVVITGVINTTCWTARAVGSGFMWLVRPRTAKSVAHIVPESRTQNTPTDIETQFEIITPEQITELETGIKTEKHKNEC